MTLAFTYAARRAAILPSVLVLSLVGVQGCGLVDGDDDAASGGSASDGSTSTGSAFSGDGGNSASGGSASGGEAFGGGLGVGPDDCETADETDCRDSSYCSSYLGQAIDEAAACHAPLPTFLGCYSSAIGCDGALVIAQDESGQGWQFPSSCIPPTFEAVGTAVYDPCSLGSAGAGNDDDATCYCSVK